MDELKKLILFIQLKYEEISEEWTKNDKYFPLNMKKFRVEDIYKYESLLLYVMNYRNFINERAVELINSIQTLDDKNIVRCRVKNLNSIQYKIENYEKNHENGKIPIKKCLNDLFGIRMIFEEEINYDIINKYIKENFPKLKCIPSIKGEYEAVHIYFGNNNNTRFQWELQLWDKKHEKSNYSSHAKHKQGYTKWENNIYKED